MENIILNDHVPNMEIRKRTNVTDIIHRVWKLRWNLAEYLNIKWRPRKPKRKNGRPTDKMNV